MEDPEESEMPPEDVEVWIRVGQFQFYPDWGDDIMGRRGNVEASWPRPASRCSGPRRRGVADPWRRPTNRPSRLAPSSGPLAIIERL